MSSGFLISGKNTMLTAGAGSGKTTALADAVVRILNDFRDVKLEQILLITFTNKAVEEMKEKIFQKIIESRGSAGENDREYWDSIFLSFNRNSVYTFDAFFSSILREYGFYIGIDPGFTILDEHQKSQLTKRIEKFIRSTLSDIFSGKKTPDYGQSAYYKKILQYFGSYQVLLEFIMSLMANRDRNQRFISFIDNRSPEDIWKDIHDNWLLPFVELKVKEFIEFFTNNRESFDRWGEIEFSQEGAKNARDSLIAILKAIDQDPDQLKLILNLLLDSFPRKPTGKNLPEEFVADIVLLQARKKHFTGDKMGDFYRQIIADETPEEITFVISVLKHTVFLANEGKKIVNEFKLRTGKLEFEDILYFTLLLLRSKPHLKNRVKNQFQFLFIDEFQDTAPSQLELIEQIFDIHNTGTVFVGDAKQSIYRFRNAEVRIIRQVENLLNTTTEPERFQKIPLINNYRSFPDLIKLYNSVFTRIFAPSKKDEDFRAIYDEDQVFPEADLRESLKRKNDKWLMARLQNSFPGMETSSLAYVNFVGYERKTDIYEHITELVLNILKRPDSKKFLETDQGYPLIGIILPTTSGFELLEQNLVSAGVDLSVVAKRYFQTPEIVALKNLLRYYTRPWDRFALAALLKSLLIGLNEKEIANYFDQWLFLPVTPQGEEWKQQIAGQLDQWLAWMDDKPLKNALWQILFSSPFLFYLEKQHNANEIIANVSKFIRNLPELSPEEILQTLEANELVKEENALAKTTSPVVLMTIHKSKGLRFHHVITQSADPNEGRNSEIPWAQFTLNSQNRYITAPRLFPPNGLVEKESSSLRKIISFQEKIEDIEESKRLAYVAFTRAVQALTVYNRVPSEKLQSEPETRDTPVHAVLWNYFTELKDINSDLAKDLNFSGPDFYNFEIIEKKEDEEKPTVKIPPEKDLIYWPLPASAQKKYLKIKISEFDDYLENPNDLQDDSNSNKTDLDETASEFGNALHRIMEKNIDTLLAGNMETDTGNSEKMKKHLSRVATILSNNFNDYTAFTEIPVTAEYTIVKDLCEINITLEGVLDLLLKSPQDKWILLDYKTGIFNPDKHISQLAVYREILDRDYHIKSDRSGLIFTNPDSGPEEVHFLDENAVFREFDLYNSIEKICSRLFPDLT